MNGLSEQELMERAERALHLAETLPSHVRDGNSSVELVSELAHLLQSLPIESASRPQLEWPEPLRAILLKVLDYIRASERSALEWMQSTVAQVDRIARRREMQKAYESRRGSH